MRLIHRHLAENHIRELRRFAKFLVVGTIGFVIDTGVLNLLILGFHLNGSDHVQTMHWFGQTIVLNSDWLAAKVISVTLGIINNFLWNRFWVYPDSRSKPLGHQLAQFFIVSLAGFVLTLVVFSMLSSLTRPRFSVALALNLAQVGAVGIVLIWNFLVNRLWTYGDVEGSSIFRRSAPFAGESVEAEG